MGDLAKNPALFKTYYFASWYICRCAYRYIYIYIYNYIHYNYTIIYNSFCMYTVYSIYSSCVSVPFPRKHLTYKVSFSKRTPSPLPALPTSVASSPSIKRYFTVRLLLHLAHLPAFSGGNPQARSPGFACGTGGSRRCLGSRSCGSTAFGLDLAARWQGSAPRGRNASRCGNENSVDPRHSQECALLSICVCVHLSTYVI